MARTRRNHRRPHRSLRLEGLESRQLMAADTVLHWNDILIEAIRRDTSYPGPGWASRNMAIVQLAVYDTVNAFSQTHSSYYSNLVAPDGASRDAAIAAAAYTALAGVYPEQLSYFDAELSSALAAIPDGPAEDMGTDLGQQIAQQILALRAGDGAFEQVPYSVKNEPGHWRPDPTLPQEQQAWGPEWGAVVPFALDSALQFDVPPPPDLNSAEYLAAYEEVKSLGGVDSTTRTADQTEVGIFWGYDRAGMGPPTIMYVQAARTIAELEGNTLEENARLLALVTLAMADAGVASWEVKYEHDFWRPVTAIREGDADGNDLTVGDADWVPLGAPGGDDPNFTPPFPAYVSGHATFGAAAFRTLAHFYGTDEYSFTLSSDELPGVTRTYHSFSEAAEENGVSRIYLGIHWNFDSIHGQSLGNSIADYVNSQFLVPLNGAAVGFQQPGGGYRTIVHEGSDPVDITLRASGSMIEVIDRASQSQIMAHPANDLNAVRIHLANGAADRVRVNHYFGGPIQLEGGIEIVGGANEEDHLEVVGTPSSELILFDGDIMLAHDTEASITGIDHVTVMARGGDDWIAIGGEQHGRSFDVNGGIGHNTFQVASFNAKMDFSENGGEDTLDFTESMHGVSVEMKPSVGYQSIGGGNFLRLAGDFEILLGSEFDDWLSGNHLPNKIMGMGGNDAIYGRAGADLLLGGDGDDILAGNMGADTLVAGAGRDLLIGGLGYDQLSGDSDEDILIGGQFEYELNDLALRAILGEWRAARPRDQRIANLSNNNPSPTRVNGNFFVTTGNGGTVIEDGKSDELVSDSVLDWIFASPDDDIV